MRVKLIFFIIFVSVFLVFFLFNSISTASNIRDGLVGYWPLDENGKDLAGKSEGKLEGGAKWVKNGRFRGAVELDGKTGCVTIKGFTLTTLELTAVAWMNGWIQGPWAGIMCSRNDPMTLGWNYRSKHPKLCME